jgi:hypothetical protein
MCDLTPRKNSNEINDLAGGAVRAGPNTNESHSSPSPIEKPFTNPISQHKSFRAFGEGLTTIP